MELNTANTALLVMDMQAGIFGAIAEPAPLIANLQSAIAAARSKKIPVIYVVVGFRQGAPEISDRNRIFSASKQRIGNVDMNQFMQVIPELTPVEGEITIVKRRVSAFAGSDLEVVLRALNVTHLVLSGIATGGVVLSTLREAADKDFQLTVIADCCADTDKDTHEFLTTKIFTKQADVISVQDWTA